MGKSKYLIDLTDLQRKELLELVSGGEHNAKKLRRARILLRADEGWTDGDIAEALDCARSTVQRTREKYHDRGGLSAIERKAPSRDYETKLDGRDEAYLIRLACSEPPPGRSRWTLRVLAGRREAMDETEIESISYETVRQTLKKNELLPHRSKRWVIPPDRDAEFVYHMERVLDLYDKPYDPDRPVVCVDESRKLLRGHETEPFPAEPGAAERVDHHYERNGRRRTVRHVRAVGGVAAHRDQ